MKTLLSMTVLTSVALVSSMEFAAPGALEGPVLARCVSDQDIGNCGKAAVTVFLPLTGGPARAVLSLGCWEAPIERNVTSLSVNSSEHAYEGRDFSLRITPISAAMPPVYSGWLEFSPLKSELVTCQLPIL